MSRPIAIVTGASSGIGAASARELARAGFQVYCAARRIDRLHTLAAEIGGIAVECDVTDADSVHALAQAVGGRCDLLVNNAGAAFGQDPLADADLADWQKMYDVNVLGAARITQALLPALEATNGTVIFITSTAAETAYEGGAGYCGTKAAERYLANSLRLELSGKPIRVCEISPGMVHTEEFSLVRFDGDQTKADAVYAGVDQPLIAEDIAECVRFAATLPEHVVVERLVVRPLAQAANWKVHRS